MTTPEGRGPGGWRARRPGARRTGVGLSFGLLGIVGGWLAGLLRAPKR